ncbi:MAG: hypothetical protein JRJ09_12820 [Deltaproteobacteria bacterium]|nr:hypothetical protein [Deltaproteobacteria bacterium]MBW2112183.1 hypothetical protein [Deltaproteobacteria bacterium]HDZ90712.1 hypothetical protein [Deltaproteobacteria bacterium]
MIVPVQFLISNIFGSGLGVKRFLSYVVGLIVVFGICDSWGYVQEDCIRCHRDGTRESALHIPIDHFNASVHGREIDCQACHTGVVDQDHATTKGSGAVNCGQCHEQENSHGSGAKVEHRPRCYSCHGTHAVFEKESELSSVNGKNLTKTCKTCHPVECGERDWLSWLPSLQIASHNKQDFARVFDTDNCLGCHQGMAAHGEDEPLDDQDCYRCHMAPEKGSPLLGNIHPRADLEKHPAIFAAGFLYLLLMLALFSGGFAFYIRKFSRKRKDRRR